MSLTRAQQVKRAVESVISKDSGRKSILEDCARYAIPREKDLVWQINDYYPEGEKPQPIDGLAVYCLSRFVSFIYSNTIGSMSDLFSLKDIDEKRNEVAAHSAWYSDLTEKVIKLIQSSKFATTGHEVIYYWAGYGQGFHSVEMDPLSGKLQCRAYSPAAGIWMSIDADGDPSGIHRKVEYSAAQAIDKFDPKKLPDVVIKAAADPSKEDTQFTFYYRVAKRRERKRELKTMQGMAWEGLWVCSAGGKDQLVEEHGFRSFPYQCPRFMAVDGEAHGRGLVHQAMFDIRAKQTARSDYFNAIEKAIDPTMVTTDDDLAEDFDNRAGAVNIIEDDVQNIRELVSQASIPACQELNTELTQAIRQSMMTDLVEILSNDKVYNNPQTMHLIDQQVSAILPAITRLSFEFFEQFVTRVVDLIVSRDEGLKPNERLLDPVPEGLLREDGQLVYSVAFSMRINDKLKSLQNMNIMSFIEQAMAAQGAFVQNPRLAALMPEEKVYRYLATNHNVDSDLINSEKDEKKAWKEYQAEVAAAKQQELAANMMKPIDAQKRNEAGSPAEGMADEQTQ